MKEHPIEPPPLPKVAREHSSEEPLHEEMRANQLMVVGAFSILTMIVVPIMLVLWLGGRPKGIGTGELQVSQGDEVSVMGSGADAKALVAEESNQPTGEKEDNNETVSAAGNEPNVAGQSGQSPPESHSEGREPAPVDESMIMIPSGKVSSDAVAVALGDAFNPFLEAATGNEIVYVIDVSGSMDGDRYRRVSAELIEAIQGLKSHQKFNIILFSAHATAFRDDGIVAATQPVKRAAAVWLGGQFCGGSTDPSAAMEMAVKMAPEKIVVLSDGEFDIAIPTYVTALNQSLRATIDCIGFDSQSSTLKEIAASNGPGRFYFVK